MAEDKEGGVASYEQLQEALFGPGANSGGGLPPGTDRDDVSACSRASRTKRVAPFSLSLSLLWVLDGRVLLCAFCARAPAVPRRRSQAHPEVASDVDGFIKSRL